MLDLDSLIGRTIGGDCTILQKLGEGGMGAVFRALLADGSSVAVKILQPNLATEPVIVARFEREALMAGQIDHPNVVRILGRGIEEGVPYMVMELVEGRDLFEVISKDGKLSPARAATIASQICDAVATAHDRGIIHRDLKPENLMLTGDPSSPGGEWVKLFDFGVAKQSADLSPDGRSITVAGAIVGTPAYMSPEQCLGEPADARSDVYACGAVLYHLVTGRTPFEDEHAMQMLFRHVNEEPRLPSELVPGLDPGLEATILKALRKRPEERHQCAHELWEELVAALPRLARHEHTPPPVSPLPPRPMMRGATWELPPHNPLPPSAEAVVGASAARKAALQANARGGLRRRAPLFVGAAAALCVGLALLGWLESSLARTPGSLGPSAADAALPHNTHVSADIVP